MADNKTGTGKAATKSETYQKIAEATGLSRKQVASVFDALAQVAGEQLGKKGPGVFTVPGLVRLTRKFKPATKARQGINPFTKEPQMFKAKPATNVVRARPVKGLKDAVAK